MRSLDMFVPPPAKPPVNPALAALRASLGNLADRDRATAESLLSQASRGLSVKQSALAASLVARAASPAPVMTDGLGAIVDMLASAAATLKFPVIRFEADGTRYRLSRSGPMSREPGSVNVSTDEKAFDARTYFGRIDLGGTFQPHHQHGAEAATAIGAALRAFAAAPAEQARIYGQKFGRCCFCGLELTNAASRFAGYGPICAEKFGLPWGARS